jgi:hypothetical protein
MGAVLSFPPDHLAEHLQALPTKDPNIPSMDEAIEQLKALGIPYRQCTDFHLKVGSLNYYPKHGVVHLDGALHSYEQRGFSRFLEAVKDLSLVKTGGVLFPNLALDHE